MKSAVHFIDLRATVKENFSEKLERLMDTAGIGRIVSQRDLTAIKIHFGEAGNAAFIRPIHVRRVVDTVRRCGGLPFLTDANTLYAGTRSDAVNHLTTAIQNGFAFSVVDAPLVIADGLRGKTEMAVPVAGKHFSEAFIGTEIVRADALVSVAHFKGHELSGFGGAIKNVGMGCASRKGKMAQHSSVSPKVDVETCVACGDCAERCAQAAIEVGADCAQIHPERCVGCGECILICPNGAIKIQWNQSVPVFLESMVDYTAAVLQNKAEKALFLNFLTDVSPACDCMPVNDAPIVRNIGVLASNDPVAIDQASVDLVNAEPALAGSCLEEHPGPGLDKFRTIYPKVDWEIQLAYGEKTGLGSRAYDLVRI
jgi:uncharacterized Fe-S center protein